MAARNIPIDWIVPPDLQAEYATNVLAQHGEHEFFLLFFQAQPPIILGEKEERQKQVNELRQIPAKCIAKIIISPERVEEVIKLLQSQLDNYQATFKKGANKET
jgi:hypothetical protein